jgi:hypothetical protein
LLIKKIVVVDDQNQLIPFDSNEGIDIMETFEGRLVLRGELSRFVFAVFNQNAWKSWKVTEVTA